MTSSTIPVTLLLVLVGITLSILTSSVSSSTNTTSIPLGTNITTSTTTTTSSSSSSSPSTESAAAVVTTINPSSFADTSIANGLVNNQSRGEGRRRSYDDCDARINDVKDEDDSGDPRFSMETFVTILVTLTIVLTNCTIIMVAAWTDAFNNFNKIFVYSMTLADLLVGLFVTPYSIFLSVYRRWVFAGDTFCNIEAYFLMCLSGAKVFSLTWLNVDHYIAVRKPERYNVMMSQTRSLCWVFFCWLAPISFCIPPIFSMDPSVFNNAVYICQANTHCQMAYVATAGALVSLPALVALFVTNVYIFTKSYKKNILFYEKVFVELSTRPWKYQTTFVMCSCLFLFWIPYIVTFWVQEMIDHDVNAKVQFYFFWLGVTSCFTNFFVLIVMCADFRQAVKDLYRLSEWCPFCRRRARNRRFEYDSDVNVITVQKK